MFRTFGRCDLPPQLSCVRHGKELLQLADWLEQERVTQVAMECTVYRVYWKRDYKLIKVQGLELW